MKTKCIVSPRKKEIKKNTEFVTIVLLCDSPGYRMKSYGPISLVNINNTKLIDLQIQCIKNVFENFELIICVGFDAEKICKHIKSKYDDLNIRIVENQLYAVSNSCESLRISLNNTSNSKVLICDGNLIINKKCLENIDIENSCVLIEKNPCENLEIGLNTDDDKFVQHFSYGAKFIWSEIIFLDGKDIIESLRKIIVNYDSKTRFIFEAINELIKMKYSIRSIANIHKIIKVNNIKMYHSLKDNKV